MPNPLNNGEWDNLPAQRCFWYQVQKVTPGRSRRSRHGAGLSLHDRLRQPERSTPGRCSNGNGNPVVQNAALICPYVVNVIPQTFFVR